VQIPFRLVDVFAARPLAGNQLCVIPDPVELPTEAMQAVSLEIGFSETTFVTEVGEDRYSVRIFTPGAEMPFAGHPTLGTAFVMVSEGRVRSPLIQMVKAGEIPVEVDAAAGATHGTASMRQLPPTFGDEVPDRSAAAAAIGLEESDLHPELPVQTVSTGLPQLIVPLRDEATVVRARAEEARMAAVLPPGGDCIYLFAMTGEREAKARMFGADIGVSEDPATGSAAGPLGAYLVEHGVISSGRLTIHQGAEVARPSTLLVDAERDGSTWAIVVSGQVWRVGEGVFDLPF
jgi:trans-2,3-dihydro-3-hydroxyanthranilate isomerase